MNKGVENPNDAAAGVAQCVTQQRDKSVEAKWATLAEDPTSALPFLNDVSKEEHPKEVAD